MPKVRFRCVLGSVWLVACAFAHPALAKDGVLKVSHFLPANSNYQVAVLEPWCAQLAKESAGRLSCQIHPAMQLGGAPPLLADQVKTGAADIVMTSTSYTSGRFPYTEALEQPFTLPPDGRRGSQVMWAYTERVGHKDYADYKLLAIFSGSGTVISTARKPITNLDGFKAVQLRSPSRTAARLLSALGGVPVSMAPPQIAEATAAGVIDGAIATWELVPALKLQQVTRYHLQSPPQQAAFTQNPLVMLMNKERYEGLPADLRRVIDRLSGPPLVAAAGDAWDRAIADGRRIAEAAGNRTLTLAVKEYDSLRKLAVSVENEWAQEVSAKGLDGHALVKQVRQLAQPHFK